MSKQLDTIGWYIATLHQLLGHRKAAAILGQPIGPAERCVLCLFEAGRASHADVIDRLGVEAT